MIQPLQRPNRSPWTPTPTSTRSEYGSPKVAELTPKVEVVSVSADGLTAEIKITPLTKGHVHELKLAGIRNKDGLPLVHAVGYYTLNEIPGK